MRPLTANQAHQCETATAKRCRCRCGGALHGTNRVTDPAELADLPADDPHYAPLDHHGVQLCLFGLEASGCLAVVTKGVAA